MSALTPIQAVRSLVAYGLRTELIEKDDAVFTANMLFDVLGIEPDAEFTPFGGEDLPLEDILAALLDDAVARGHIEDGIASRDLFDTKLTPLRSRAHLQSTLSGEPEAGDRLFL